MAPASGKSARRLAVAAFSGRPARASARGICAGVSAHAAAGADGSAPAPGRRAAPGPGRDGRGRRLHPQRRGDDRLHRPRNPRVRRHRQQPQPESRGQDQSGGAYYDVVVVVEGTPYPVVVRRKSDVAGVWINTSSVLFASVPSYYAIASTRPIDQIAGPAVLERNSIGFAHIKMTPGGGIKWKLSDYELSGFRAAVIRLKQAEHLYVVEAKDGVTFTGRSLFRSTIALPANVPVGPLVARTYLFRNGEVLSAHIARVTLERKGIERVLHDFAFRYPFTYGMIAVILAVPPGSWARRSSAARWRERGRSIALQEPRGHGVKSLLAQQPHAQAVVAEQRLERDIEDVEPAGVGPERRQHQSAAVADEAGAAHREAVQGQAGGGVHVPGDLVRHVARRRHVAEHDALDLDVADDACRRVVRQSWGRGCR